MGDAAVPPLVLAFVPGVMPDKWAARFRARFGSDALVLRVVNPDDAASCLIAGQNRTEQSAVAGLIPLPVDADIFHAIPLYIEVDDQKGRVPGRQIGLAWRKDYDHPYLEELTGIVRGRTANTSRGQGAQPKTAQPKTAQPKSAQPKTPQPKFVTNKSATNKPKPPIKSQKKITRKQRPKRSK